MPFIISFPNGGVLRGERSVSWTTARTVQGARVVAWTTEPQILRGERVVDWIPGRPVRGSRDVTWTSSQVAMPTVVRPGRRARTLNLNSSTLGGAGTLSSSGSITLSSGTINTGLINCS